MQVMRPKFILSACLAGLSEETNRGRTALLQDELDRRGFAYVKAKGSYKGVEEDSFILFMEGWPSLGRGLDLLQAYGQESGLYVDAQGMAWLAYPDSNEGRLQLLGQFVEREEATARRSEGWTCVDGRYFVVEPRR